MLEFRLQRHRNIRALDGVRFSVPTRFPFLYTLRTWLLYFSICHTPELHLYLECLNTLTWHVAKTVVPSSLSVAAHITASKAHPFAAAAHPQGSVAHFLVVATQTSFDASVSHALSIATSHLLGSVARTIYFARVPQPDLRLLRAHTHRVSTTRAPIWSAPADLFADLDTVVL